MSAAPLARREAWPFLSTLSLRRATWFWRTCLPPCGNFYPRSPCGERRELPRNGTAKTDFYPRSPCGERHFQFSPYPPLCEFLSTLSLRRATKVAVGVVLHGGISIHALLAESDIQNGTRDIIENQFLSTLSLRRATHPYRHLAVRNQISIHALLAESDPLHWAPLRSWYISIHALLAESDSFTASITSAVAVFLSTLSLRRATVLTTEPVLVTFQFLSTLSLRRATLQALFCRQRLVFLSTLSLRRATAGMVWDNRHFKFLSTLSLRRATN